MSDIAKKGDIKAIEVQQRASSREIEACLCLGFFVGRGPPASRYEEQEMTVQQAQPLALAEMTPEELLVEMVKPDTTDLDKVRIRERLVEMHEWLAHDITRRYRYRGEPIEDLRQAAYVGLMKAINGFDAGLGHDFRGYAVVTMTGEVKRHFRDRTWAIRVPRVYQERRSELNKLVSDLSQTLGRSPTVASGTSSPSVTSRWTPSSTSTRSSRSSTGCRYGRRRSCCCASTAT
jgi:RNA polymerase sigma factor (sigma-70 family)